MDFRFPCTQFLRFRTRIDLFPPDPHPSWSNRCNNTYYCIYVYRNPQIHKAHLWLPAHLQCWSYLLPVPPLWLSQDWQPAPQEHLRQNKDMLFRHHPPELQDQKSIWHLHNSVYDCWSTLLLTDPQRVLSDYPKSIRQSLRRNLQNTGKILLLHRFLSMPLPEPKN